MSDDVQPGCGDNPRALDAVAIPSARYAAVCFEGAGRQVRRVVTLFDDPHTADLFAIEQGWSDYAVGPASLVLPLRDQSPGPVT